LDQILKGKIGAEAFLVGDLAHQGQVELHQAVALAGIPAERVGGQQGKVSFAEVFVVVFVLVGIVVLGGGHRGGEETVFSRSSPQA